MEKQLDEQKLIDINKRGNNGMTSNQIQYEQENYFERDMERNDQNVNNERNEIGINTEHVDDSIEVEERVSNMFFLFICLFIWNNSCLQKQVIIILNSSFNCDFAKLSGVSSVKEVTIFKVRQAIFHCMTSKCSD